jgi:hypothetical protein
MKKYVLLMICYLFGKVCQAAKCHMSVTRKLSGFVAQHLSGS